MPRLLKKPLIVILVVFGVAAVAMLAQSSGKLTRPRAKAIVEESAEFKTPASEPIWLGTDFRMGDPIPQSIRWDLADDLVSHFYLEKNGEEFTIGPEGKKLESEWGRDPHRENSRLIPLATRNIVEITGVALDGDTARVEFTWRYKWARIGAHMADAGHYSGERLRAGYNNDKIRPGFALLRRYDDGWRVTLLTLKPKNGQMPMNTSGAG